MARYRSFGQLDDPFLEDGDPAFSGIDLNTEPVLLQSGTLQLGENIRIDQGVVKTRKGLNQLVQFVDDYGLGLIKFLDPDSDQETILMISNYSLLDLHGNAVVTIENPYPTSARVIGIQAFEQVILFGQGQRPKSWSGDAGDAVTDFSITPADGAVDFVCPNADFGNYISNRLAVPLTSDSPSTVAFSDILQPNQFENNNTFFCNKGTSDKTLAISQFAENQALVLNKNSIHLINNTHSLGNNSTSYEISRQYGIAGPRAFAQNGSYIYFISNEGNIQVLVPSSDPAKGLGISISKITLDQEPLSKPITPIIKQINLQAIESCVAHYHRNFVYFALPINGSIEPNCIACYDSLNSQWVSIDTFGIPDFRIKDIKSLNDELYILANKGLYQYNASDDSDDGYPIVSRFTSRSFLMRDRGIKKFINGSISMSGSNGQQLTVKTTTSDPDTTVLSKNETIEKTSDMVSRFDIRQRGYSAKIEITSSGKPATFKSLSLEAIGSSKTTGDFE